MTSQSNSKSEDTQDFTPDEAVVCAKCGYGEWRHDSLKHPCTVFEPPQDTTIQDVVNGTPKGQEAVQKAIDDSIKVQNEMTKKAQDTSLDDILAILDDHHSIVTDELGKSCAKELLAWHKAEIAKLFEQIRSEAVRMNIPWGDGNGYDVVKAVDVEALTRLEAKQ